VGSVRWAPVFAIITLLLGVSAMAKVAWQKWSAAHVEQQPKETLARRLSGSTPPEPKVEALPPAPEIETPPPVSVIAVAPHAVRPSSARRKRLVATPTAPEPIEESLLPVIEAEPQVAPVAPPTPEAVMVATPIATPATTPAAAERTDKRRAADPLDAELLLRAFRALRSEHRPDKAEGLLAKYHNRHPDGPLGEDALALGIEAAAARHSPNATVLAQQYLERFPGGRFRDMAEKVRANFRAAH
jgi:hypothetical protein